MIELIEKFCELQNLFPPGTPIAIIVLPKNQEPILVKNQNDEPKIFIKVLDENYE